MAGAKGGVGISGGGRSAEERHREITGATKPTKSEKEATLAAIAEANKFPELRKAMAQVLAESKALADRSTKAVKALIVSLKIVP